jgi:hypothetical protein
MTKSSAQLEREAEQTRAELTATLEELRSRITPGQLVDQTLAYARESNVGALVRNLGRDARDNPLPLALMGAGLAWLMMTNGRRRADGRLPAAGVDGARASGAIDATMTRARGTEEGPADWAEAAGRGISEGATTAVGHSSGDGRGTVARASSAASAAAERASGVYHNATAAGGSFLTFCGEHPVVLAGIGVALGALLGAALPSSRGENAPSGAPASAEGFGDFDRVRVAPMPEPSVVPAAPGEHVEP